MNDKTFSLMIMKQTFLFVSSLFFAPLPGYGVSGAVAYDFPRFTTNCKQMSACRFRIRTVPKFVHSCVWLFLFSAMNALSGIQLPVIFSEGAVLQRSPATSIFGKAKPGQMIEISLGKETFAKTLVDEYGNWRVSLDLSHSAQGPHQLLITDGDQELLVEDILVGQVWLASGQSNMGFRLTRSLGGRSVASAPENPLIREFTSPQTASEIPMENFRQGTWLIANAENRPLFSGVAYYFAHKLHQHLEEPVGIINKSWGGTHIESWTRSEALMSDSVSSPLREGVMRNLEQWEKLRTAQQAYASILMQWLDQSGFRTDLFEVPENPPSRDLFIGEIEVPGKLSENPGVIWLRKVFDLPPLASNYPLRLRLGVIEGHDAVYWNDRLVEQTDLYSYVNNGPRFYFVPRKWVNVGENTLVVRIVSPWTAPAIKGRAKELSAIVHPLIGKWEIFEEEPLRSKAPLPLLPDLDFIDPKTRVGFLYNGLIHPLRHYRVAGVLWYQGESNCERAWQYRESLPHMINDWRLQMENPELPFYLCQLPNFGLQEDQPGESQWAELREAQTLATRMLPHVHQAVLIDVGEAGDIHPRDKRSPGERLARMALAREYGRKLFDSGPVFQSAVIEGNSIRVIFEAGTDGGLRVSDGGADLTGFAVSGENRSWQWADARIDGNTVIVHSPDVPHPIAVRYAWADNPICNLTNHSGLPAGPFRSDNFPLTTQNAGF
jgi:sialate O-acetylesterase